MLLLYLWDSLVTLELTSLLPLVGSPETDPLAVKLLDNQLYILKNLNMLSVNQLNAQMKLTDTWKAINNKNSSLKNLKQKMTGSDDRSSRSVSIGDLIEEAISMLLSE